MTKAERTYRWATRRVGNDGFVMEYYQEPSGSWKYNSFGPMPPSIVLTFVEMRRRVVAIAMKERGANYVLNH